MAAGLLFGAREPVAHYMAPPMEIYGIEPITPDAPHWLKLAWGVIAMAVGYIMISTIGINGVKIIANFGGMFAALIMIGATASLGILIFNHKKYDMTIEGNKDEIFENVTRD